MTLSFNPRARAGRDAELSASIAEPHRRFNPRALRGATSQLDRVRIAIQRFNPRARAGRDDACARRADVPRWFQSTRPRGARRDRYFNQPHEALFQSTRPRGARRLVRSMMPIDQFQSTRPRGARRQSRDAHQAQRRFQSTRPRGARRLSLSPASDSAEVSIHAPARGATSAPRSHCRREHRRFNPRAPRGATAARGNDLRH